MNKICHGISLPSLSPIAFHIGPLFIRWYALAYIAGIVVGWLYILSLLKSKKVWRSYAPPLSPAHLESLVTWVILGVILGGRLGYVTIYQPHFYWTHPTHIFAIWRGGMSFHGGAIGVILAILVYCFVHKRRMLSTYDLVTAAIPIGLFFGRLANFVNQELTGRVTDVPWAVCFTNQTVARHPSQLYEAGLEGLLLFLLLRLFIAFGALKKPGFVSGAFLFFYAAGRIFVENFRTPDIQIGYLWHHMTMGMLLSFPMLLAGALIMTWSALRRTPPYLS